jgi:hypothetical protein
MLINASHICSQYNHRYFDFNTKIAKKNGEKYSIYELKSMFDEYFKTHDRLKKELVRSHL